MINRTPIKTLTGILRSRGINVDSGTKRDPLTCSSIRPTRTSAVTGNG